MKNKIFTYLDKNYPIKDTTIKTSFDKDITTVVERIFGVNDINFFDWVNDRIGLYFNTINIDTQVYYKGNRFHRDNDLPALMVNSDLFWYQNGKLHRDNDLPAMIWGDHLKQWYQHGKLHRDNDKPAMVMVMEGGVIKSFYKNGEEYNPNEK